MRTCYGSRAIRGLASMFSLSSSSSSPSLPPGLFHSTPLFPTQKQLHTARSLRRNLSTTSGTASSHQPRTFENQAKLPRLPVPDLESTLDKYVTSLLPLIEQSVSVFQSLY